MNGKSRTSLITRVHPRSRYLVQPPPDEIETNLAILSSPIQGEVYSFTDGTNTIWLITKSVGASEILCLYSWKTTALTNFVAKCFKDFSKPGPYTKVFSWQGKDWQQCNVLRKRSEDTIFFERKEEMIERTKGYLKSKEEYERRGILHLFVILLTGPPGSGKTASGTVLAAQIDAPIYLMTLSEKLSEQDLKSRMFNVPKGAIIFLDDGRPRSPARSSYYDGRRASRQT